MNDNYLNNRRYSKNSLYNNTCINTINNGKNLYSENVKNNRNFLNNKILLNLNLIKPKLYVDEEKNNSKKGKYTSSLVKTYNNIGIIMNSKNYNNKKLV